MKTLKTVLIACAAGFAGAFICIKLMIRPENISPGQPVVSTVSLNESAVHTPAQISTENGSVPEAPVDFNVAATRAIPSVVYINSISQGTSYSYWDLLFGGGSSSMQTRVSSGSGVIFRADGYIVTNNHVVGSAEKIEVVYNKHVYEAELIGTDPSTDLAVLKINASNLPAITLGTAQALQVGEWVVAVGNPFSLSSTVTVGIVSAKGRRIGILEDKFPIESFIQTDAAINPGNSGGALVNKNGELVGINTAILGSTYTGYAFAVPVDIAKKIVDDLIKYGIVQKGFYGGSVADYDYQYARKYNLGNIADFNGVFLESVEDNGPAAQAGLKPGDIITKINETLVNSVSAFEEEISYRYPGDKISITYTRNGKTYTTSLTLVNRNGTTEKVKRKIYTSQTLGAQLEASDYGVKVFNIEEGYMKRLGVPENYTIIAINRVKVNNPEDVIEFFEKYKGRVSLYGMNGAREVIPYNFMLR